METSAVEKLGRSEPMSSAVKNVPRGGGFTVGGVTKGGTYANGVGTNDDVELTARKIGGYTEINEEDLVDPRVDVLAERRQEATRALALYFDNACLGTTAAVDFANGIAFESVYKAITTNGDSNSIESGYTANDNLTQVTAANFVLAMAAGTGYNALNDWLGDYEEGDFFDEENTVVFANPAFRRLLRGVKDADGNPFLVPGVELNKKPSYNILGYQTHWTKGAKTSAVNTQTPEGRPLLIIGNREQLIRGDASLAPNIPVNQPGFALQRSRDGIGFLSDKAYMKAGIRRGFKVGHKAAFSVLEVTA